MPRRLAGGVLAGVLLGSVIAAALSSPAIRAASPTPAPNPDVTLAAEPMLGGVVAPGEWLAVRVDVENRGPAITGELRLAPSSSPGSTYGIAVELPSGARQEHFLYTQAGVFGSRFEVSLVEGDTIHARLRVAVDVSQTTVLRVYVIAEHPERINDPLGDALAAKGAAETKIVTITPDDLPPRAEAWSSIDLLVWQDIPSAQLDGARLAALQTWLALGGDLVLIGGSLGTQMFGAFPADVLPFVPTATVEVETADLTTMLGVLPAGATPLAALSGDLQRGTVIWRTQPTGAVVGARQSTGQGTVTLLGIDPLTGWLAGSAAEDTFWERALPSAEARSDARLPTDDQFLVNALGQLPAVQLPGSSQLLLLIAAYVIAIGPLNYLVLRRRDRREWAWLTMPLTIAVFGVAAYGIGITLKGGSVIVNELAIVAGAAGSDRGMADVHVGVFSPSRDSFDLRVGPAALVTGPAQSNGQAERPIDVLLGDPATLRRFDVGFGAMRAFRAQTSVGVPRLDAELALTENALTGTVTNSSATALDDVSIVYGGSARILGDMAPGTSQTVNLVPGGRNEFREPYSSQLYPFVGAADSPDSRTAAVRRALVQHLDGGWEEGMPGGASSTVFGHGPVILAWLDGGRLDIDTGSSVERVGATLFVLPAQLAISGHVVFSGGLLESTVDAVDSVVEGFKEADVFYLGRGTLSVAYRPAGFDGQFTVSSLSLRVASDPPGPPSSAGEDLSPLPAEEQPASDSPLASSPRPGEGSPDAPRLQLFDRSSGVWVEFEPITLGSSYTVVDPQRYVDEAGAFRVRFVVRDAADPRQFALSARLEGAVE